MSLKDWLDVVLHVLYPYHTFLHLFHSLQAQLLLATIYFTGTGKDFSFLHGAVSVLVFAEHVMLTVTIFEAGAVI